MDGHHPPPKKKRRLLTSALDATTCGPQLAVGCPPGWHRGNLVWNDSQGRPYEGGAKRQDSVQQHTTVCWAQGRD